MTRVLITGGTGVLGRELVQHLLKGPYSVRIMSRGARPSNTPLHIEWAQARLVAGSGLAKAVADVDVLVHAASSARRDTWQVDVDGTRSLLAAACRAGIRHCIYVSIVGIDRIPLRYYQAKLATEQLVQAADLPWTILRATQFHPFINELIRRFMRGPVLLLPTDFQIQPIDPGEVAVRLAETVAAGPQGRAPDIGGPEVLTLAELARDWLAAQGLKRQIIHLPLPGRIAHGFRNGYNTCPEHRYGTIRWVDWLKRTM